ncbi:MAG TPA: hypothetical protein VM939_04170 [Gemmatimonadaceae bacterium]|nr:hypothetical protein [Gemmatimonadaceae bacterium]
MKKSLVVCTMLIAVIALHIPSTMNGQGDLRAAGARLEQGRTAERSGDLESYYTHARAAWDMVTNHPILLYHAARAAARTKRNDESLDLLRRLTPLGAPRNPAADSGFLALWTLPAFQERVKAMTDATAPLIRSDTAFMIDAPNLVVENIAYDPTDRVFYAGSMARRTILRVTRAGVSSPLLAQGIQLGQPLGMKVDSRSRVLWAAVIYPPDSSAGQLRTRSELLEIALPSGRIMRRLLPTDTARPHLLNDIVLTPRGDLYVTDSEGGAIWVLERGSASLREFLRLPGSVLYPNGIALSPDGRSLFLAHQTGVLSINLASRAVTPLTSPENGPSLLGIDGLYTVRGNILGIANSSSVEQIVYGTLARPTPTSVTCTTPLERRHPAYTIPTTGTVVGDTLFYVANSQLRRLDAKGSLRDPTVEARTVVLRLPLPRELSGAACRPGT